MTREQREADTIYRAWYKRKFGRESNDIEGEISQLPTCEDLRKRLRVVIAWLRQQAEALRNPITRAETLTSDCPRTSPYLGEGFEDLLCDVNDLGTVLRAAKRSEEKHEEKQRKSKKE